MAKQKNGTKDEGRVLLGAPGKNGDGDEAPRYSRPEAPREVVAGMGDETSLAELAKAANALVVAGGGKDDENACQWEVWRVLEVAEALGVVETDHVVRRVKK